MSNSLKNKREEGDTGSLLSEIAKGNKKDTFSRFNEYGDKKPVSMPNSQPQHILNTDPPHFGPKRTALGWLRGDISDEDFHNGKFFAKPQNSVKFEGIHEDEPKYAPNNTMPTKSSLKPKLDGIINGDGVENTVEGSVNNVFVDPASKTLKGKCRIQEPGSSGKKSVPYQRGGKFHLPILFGGEEVVAQWDPGADCTIVSPEFYNSMKKKPKLDFDIFLKGYNEGSQRGKFCEDVEFQIGNYVFDFPPAVGPSTIPLLIGVDFLRTFDIDMSVTKSTLILGEDVIPLEYTGEGDPAPEYSICHVRLESNITIPPHQGRTMRINNNVKSKELLFFEPHPFKEIQMKDTVVYPGEKIDITFMNFTDKKQKLFRGMSIGTVTECNEITIEPLSPEELSPTNDPSFLERESPMPKVINVDINGEKVEIENLGPEEHIDIDKIESPDYVELNIEDIEVEVKNVQNITPRPTQIEEDDPFITKPKVRLKSTNKVKFQPRSKFEIPNPVKVPQILLEKYKKYPDIFPATKSQYFENLASEIPDHTREMFVRSCNNISLLQAARFADSVVFFKDTFSKGGWDLGCCRIVEHVIDTGSATPVKQQMRRTPIHFEEEELEVLRTMLQAGVIQPSTSEWASPVTLVRKKSGKLRWTIDLRKVNDVTRKDNFPLPRIDDCIQTLQGKTFYCSMDAASGYWQLPISEESQERTAFICKYGLFEFLRLAQGLCNAPATYQRAMTIIMRGLQWVKAVIFLDDCLSFGNTFEETLSNTEEVLLRFQKANLKLNTKKCFFFQLEIHFLGRIISAQGISLSPDHLEVVKKWPYPNTIKKLESWLGFANYHRNHIKNYGKMADLLYKLVSKAKQDTKDTKSKGGRGKRAYQRVAVKFTAGEIESFEDIRTAIINAPVLPIPDPDKRFLVDVDTSGTHIGAELQQLVDGELRVIQYGSRCLKPAQRKYCASKREMLGAITFLRQWRYYLVGKTFLLRTDSAALTFLLSMTNHDSQMGRWIVEFANYSMILVHRAGNFHINADVMSRPDEVVDPLCKYFRDDVSLETLPCHEIGPNGESIVCKKCKKLKDDWSDFDSAVDDTLPLAGIIKEVSLDFSHLSPENNISISFEGMSNDELRVLQEQDYDFGTLIDWLGDVDGPSEEELTLASPALRHYWSVRSQFVFLEGVLHFRWEDLVESRLLLCVPLSLKDKVFFYCHDCHYEGHPGQEGTKHEVLRRFYWRGASTDCEIYCKTCPDCTTCKYRNRRRKGKMVSRHAGFPMQRCHIDTIGPISTSESGNKYILMIIDQFTKFVAAIPLPNQKGSTIAKSFISEFCGYFGVPIELHSDNGKNFIEGIFREATRRLQIQRSSTCLYFPSANGAIERQNLTLMSKMRTILRSTRDFKNWDDYVPFCAAAIRATPNRMTKFTPNFLMFGRELNVPADLAFGFPHKSKSMEVSKFVKKLVKILIFAYAKAREHIRRPQRISKRDHDRKSFDPNINVGDVVFVENTKRRKKKLSAKILPLFKGPMLVIGKVNPVVFWLQHRSKIFAEHYNKIIPDNTGHFPPWLLKLRARLFSDKKEFFVDANRNRLGSPISEIRKLFGSSDIGDESLLDNIKIIRKVRKPKAPRKPRKPVSSKCGRGYTRKSKKFARQQPPTQTRHIFAQYNTPTDPDPTDSDIPTDPFLDFEGITSTQTRPQDLEETLPYSTSCPQDLEETLPYSTSQPQEDMEITQYEIETTPEEAQCKDKISPILLKRKTKKNPKFFGPDYVE